MYVHVYVCVCVLRVAIKSVFSSGQIRTLLDLCVFIVCYFCNLYCTLIKFFHIRVIMHVIIRIVVFSNVCIATPPPM